MSDTLTWTIVATLALALAVVSYLLALCVRQITWMADAAECAKDTEHAKCMAAIMKYVGDEWAAAVLEGAAADYDSVESQRDLDRIRRLWRQDGPSIPNIWMQERADRIRIMADPDYAAYLDAMEHVKNMNWNEVAL